VPRPNSSCCSRSEILTRNAKRWSRLLTWYWARGQLNGLRTPGHQFFRNKMKWVKSWGSKFKNCIKSKVSLDPMKSPASQKKNLLKSNSNKRSSRKAPVKSTTQLPASCKPNSKQPQGTKAYQNLLKWSLAHSPKSTRSAHASQSPNKFWNQQRHPKCLDLQWSAKVQWRWERSQLLRSSLYPKSQNWANHVTSCLKNKRCQSVHSPNKHLMERSQALRESVTNPSKKFNNNCNQYRSPW